MQALENEKRQGIGMSVADQINLMMQFSEFKSVRDRAKPIQPTIKQLQSDPGAVLESIREDGPLQIGDTEISVVGSYAAASSSSSSSSSQPNPLAAIQQAIQ